MRGAPTRPRLVPNSLALAFIALFLTALIFQAITGHAAYNAEQTSHMEAGVSFWHYVSSSPFAVSVMENWQSEYLQFTLFIVSAASPTSASASAVTPAPTRQPARRHGG